jgi:hypothetical protein
MYLFKVLINPEFFYPDTAYTKVQFEELDDEARTDLLN